MSASPDPQTWVFPPLGAAVLPSDPSASFGPISRGDKIKLQWAPATAIPQIAFICANDGTIFSVSSSNTSPFTYTFNESVNNGTSHMCWFFFGNTKLGNTLTFIYDNAPTNPSVLWQQDSQLASAQGGISTVTVTASANNNNGNPSAAQTVTITQTVPAQPTLFTTTISSPSTTYISTGFSILAASATGSPDATLSSSSSNALSPGVAAGIAVAATVAFALLCLLIFYIVRLWRRDPRGGNNSNNNDQTQYVPHMSSISSPASGPGPAPIPNDYKYQPPSQRYYGPDQFAGVGRNDRTLPPVPGSGPGRAIHEVQ